MTGSTDLGDSAKGNLYLAKISPTGALLWEYGFGGPGQDVGLHVEQTADGGYIVSGWTSESGAALLLKTDSSGKSIWQSTYGGSEPVDGNCVVAAPSGGYFIVCDAEDDYAAIVIRTDQSGVEIKRSTMVNPASSRTAMYGTLCSDGGCLVAGWTDSVGARDQVYCAKTDRNGALQWQAVHEGANASRAYAVVQALDGGYALAGRTSSPPARDSDGFGSNDFYLVRINSQGAHVWSKTYGSSDGGVAYSLCRASDGGYVLAGVSGSRPCIVRTDVGGRLLWKKTLECGGGFSWASAIRQTPDGGYIVTGSHQGEVAELFLTKLAPDRTR